MRGDECLLADAVGDLRAVTRSGEGGKSTRRREYVSTPVIDLWRGATWKRCPDWGGIWAAAGGVGGLYRPKMAKAGEYAGMI